MTADAQMETIKHHVCEIENPIIKIELIHSTLHKLAEYIERDAELKDVIFRVIDDLGFAAVEARKCFDKLHAAAHPDSPTKRVPS